MSAREELERYLVRPGDTNDRLTGLLDALVAEAKAEAERDGVNASARLELALVRIDQLEIANAELRGKNLKLYQSLAGFTGNA